MTRDEACKMAAELSKANGKAYVIKVPDQGPGVGYDVVTDRDVDGHYIVVAYVNGYAVGGMIGGRRLITDPAAPWPEHDTACGYSPTGRLIDPEAQSRELLGRALDQQSRLRASTRTTTVWKPHAVGQTAFMQQGDAAARTASAMREDLIKQGWMVMGEEAYRPGDPRLATRPQHPVDVLKDIAETQGTPIDPEFEAAARELCDAPVSQLDRIRLVVAEWRKGCSVSDPQHAEQCSECTAGAMLAIEKILKED